MGGSSLSNPGDSVLDPLTTTIGKVLKVIDDGMDSLTGTGIEESLKNTMSLVGPFFQSVHSWLSGPEPGLKGAWNSAKGE
ncbi:hypothetical protein QFC20_004818 [Naganishia adeliensis]|uniref:Uncharacterized protein n=1 Tax=Naganishia adeliensis TaxID=92952 RepID=A0ACC2VV69_9TREE|nr:hypothetical protein QFC20_004818 [Naganishia adeliensis]